MKIKEARKAGCDIPALNEDFSGFPSYCYFKDPIRCQNLQTDMKGILNKIKIYEMDGK